MWIPPKLLNVGTHTIGLAITSFIPNFEVHFFEKESLIIDIIENENLRDNSYRGIIPGMTRQKLQLETRKIG